MAAVRANADKQDKGDVYRKQITQLRELNTLFNEQAMASGEWHVQNVRTISSSERLTKQIQQQKLGFRDMRKEWAAYRAAQKSGGTSAFGEAIKEQHALRNAMATQLTGNVFGKNDTSLMLPKRLGPELDMARSKYGLIKDMIASAATQTVNWGKNTQWAGRQITVGLTVPLGIAAVGAAALALKVDQNLTRIAKVYDTVNTAGIAQENELRAVREQSLTTATRLAQDYGVAMQDTLDITAQLAATGLNGSALHQATSEVARIATLGEMDYQQAIDMTIALQTSFKLSNEELTESFNTMNAVENATSLSIQDIAEATPRAASALSALGGTVDQMVVMLTAMKESGVDAAEGANALKSATTRLLNPTQASIEFFQKNFQIDLPKIVKEANGNIYDLMNTLGALTHGFDDLTIQQGVAELFGTYQFNRATALLTNLGDAASGMSNQTAKAMEVVGMSAEQVAGIAEREVDRWQQSISGKFKRATESLKASLVPFGLTMLQIITPVIEAVAWLVETFNSLPGGVKIAIGAVLGLAAVAGPILMLVGIFANLFGNVMKLSTWMANLRIKFKALTPEQATAEIMARASSSAFETEARSAAVLAASIRELTTAMEANALANGNMPVTTAGLMGVKNQRQLVQGANGAVRYAAGSKNELGENIGGRIATKEDRENFLAMQTSATKTAEESGKTRSNYAGIGKAIGVITAGALVFGAMKTDSSSTLDTWINISLVVASIGMMFPGMFGGALSAAKKVGTTVKGWFSGGNFGKNVGTLKSAFSSGGIRGVVSGVKEMAPRFAAIAGTAARIFLPAGILAAGAIVLKQINDELNKAETMQKALVSSGKAWADALGYTHAPGQLPGMEEGEGSEYLGRTETMDKMAESVEGLGEAMAEAIRSGRGFSAAMSQAMEVVTAGGSPEQARDAFAAALQLGGMNEIEIDRQLIKFDNIDISNADEVREQAMAQLKTAFDNSGSTFLEDAPWYDIASGMKQNFGGEIESGMRAAGLRAGHELALGIRASANDPVVIGEMFDQLTSQVNTEFKDVFDDLRDNGDNEDLFEALGIDNADEFMTKVREIASKSDEELTNVERKFRDNLMNEDYRNFYAKYMELFSTIIDGMVATGDMSEEQGNRLKGTLNSLGNIKVEFGGIDRPLINTESLIDSATGAVDRLVGRLRTATGGAGELANALGAVGGVDIEDAGRATDYMRSSMEGTMGDIYSEADRLYQANQDAALDGIRARGEATMDTFEAREKSMDKYWDNASKAQENRFKQVTKSEEAAWDNRIERVEAERDAVDEAYEARIERINATIEAEREAEDERKRIFEAEQERISRAAESFNANIDFNAAINSGDLDEAAKLANDASARNQTWAIDDAQTLAERRAEEREKALQAQIDTIQKERDARKEAYDEQLQQIKSSKDAAMEALRERQDAEKEALTARKEMAKENLAAQRDAAQKSTEAAVQNAQRSFEADRNSLAQRLRELQAFVPRNETEMREHIARIEEAYRIYGNGLQLQGSSWSKYIADSLRSNIVAASNALATDVNWTALGNAINARISAGTGVTANDLQFFIKNGRFPNQGAVLGLVDQMLGAAQRIAGRHTGGVVLHGGGSPSWSSKDRTGVPRSAGLYPSETTALLKRGEFVVNEKATRKNRALLETINQGGGPRVEPGDGHMISRHIGGITEAGPLIGGSMGQMVGQVLQGGITAWVVGEIAKQAVAAREAAAADAGTGNAGYYGPMTGSIKGALDFARTQEGKPYIWGGSGPAGQDCSGFMSIIANYILGKKPPYGRIFATGSMGGGPGAVGPFRRGGGPSNAFRIGVDPNSHTAGTLGGINVESGSGHGPMVGKRSLGAESGFQYKYYLPQADMIPKLSTGGDIKYDNTLANLHAGEKVLTAPLSRDLERGIHQLASGASNDTINVNFYGPVNAEVDVERGVEKAFKKRDAKNGRSRKIG